MPETLNHNVLGFFFRLLFIISKEKQNPLCEHSLFSSVARNHKFFSIATRIGQEMQLLTCTVAVHSSILPKAFSNKVLVFLLKQLSVFQAELFAVRAEWSSQQHAGGFAFTVRLREGS